MAVGPKRRLCPRHLLVAGSLCCLVPSILHAAQQGGIRFRSYSIESGLSQSSVRAVAQDRRGFIWLGTSDGLNRFDGASFETHLSDPADPHTLSNNLVMALAEGPDGSLWVGTVAGLNRYDPDLGRFHRHLPDPSNPEALGAEGVLALLVDREGTVWVGLDGGGLDEYRNDERGFVHHLVDTDGAGHGRDVVRALLEDREGRFWVGTDDGLFLLDRIDGSFQRFDPMDSGASDSRHRSIRSLFQDETDRIWVGVDGGGVYTLDPSTAQFIPHHTSTEPSPQAAGDPITGFAKGTGGTLWIGSYGGGLYSFDPASGTFENYTHDPRFSGSLGADRVTGVFTDNAGALWVGTYGGGVSTFHPRNFKFDPMTIPSEGVNRNYIRAFAEEGDSVLWIGSQGGGLSRLDRRTGEYTFYDHDPGDPTSLSSGEVFSLLMDRTGVLWVGSTGGWVNRLQRDADGFVRTQVELPDEANRYRNEVRALIEDSKGRVWIGVDGAGVHVGEPGFGELHSYHHDHDDSRSLGSNRVRALFEDHQGIIWVGTFGGGICQLDPETGTFTHLHHQDGVQESLADNRVLTITQGRSEEMWISTRGGLERYDPDGSGFKHLRRRDGLPNEAVYGILEDDHGTIWLSHNKGITRFDPRARTFETFSESDGLQSSEFNGGAFLRGADGRFYFGGIKGYNTFFPDSIRPHEFLPPVWITGFQIGNQPVPIGEGPDGRTLLTKSVTATESVELSHNDRVLTFEFATLNYVVPERNQYAYRMEGLEEEWHFVGTRRFASYTTLPPGDYTFRVRGANNDGRWNEAGASLQLTVHPTWWETLWFRGAIAIFLAVAAFRIYRSRVRSIERQKVRLEEEVALRTNELQTKTDELEETLTELQQTKGELLEAAHKAGMADIATGVLHNVGNILNSLRTSVSMIDTVVDNSKLSGLSRATEMIRTNRDTLGEFLSEPDVGQKLVTYLLALPDHLEEEQESISSNARRASEKLDAIASVVADQQRIAGTGDFSELLDLAQIAKEAIELESSSVERHDITLETDLSQVPTVLINRAKAHHILVNLYKNAKESMRAVGSRESLLEISVSQVGEEVVLKVRDNGEGIAPEVKDLIFTHGFSTKNTGHGFGLHSCANYAKEMGGRMWAESPGPGRGATFFLAFPVSKDEPGDAMDADAAIDQTPLETSVPQPA